MTTLTEKFEALETQLAAQAATTDAYIDTVETKLQALFDTLDIMLVNNAANTRAILAAMGQNNPCVDCVTPPLEVPPTDTTGRPIDEDKCKRVQAFLHAMTRVFTVLDTMSAFSIAFTPNLITNAIEQVIVALENGDTTPLPSFPEAVNIAGQGINYTAGNLLVGNTLVGLFSAVLLDLRDVMYGSGSAAGVQTAYDGVIDGSGMPSYAKPLVKAAAYNALYSYYFDPASMPNLTGYSGTACAFPLEGITECIDMESFYYVLEGNFYYVVVGDPVYSLNPIFTEGDFYGFTFEILAIEGTTPMRLDYYDAGGIYQGGSLLDLSTGVVTQTAHTSAIGMHSNAANLGGTFTVRICPPV